RSSSRSIPETSSWLGRRSALIPVNPETSSSPSSSLLGRCRSKFARTPDQPGSGIREEGLPIRSTGRALICASMELVADDGAAPQLAQLLLRPIGPCVQTGQVVPHDAVTDLPDVLIDDVGIFDAFEKLVQKTFAL